jgi:hypothetical protein
LLAHRIGRDACMARIGVGAGTIGIASKDSGK